MEFSAFLENEQNIYYHGSPMLFKEFDYKFLSTGKGYDQNGPGFYFTNNLKHAEMYGKYIYRVKLNLGKTVPLKGKAKKSEVIKMIKIAPDLADDLTNWDENPIIALNNAVNAIANNNPHEAFQSVWHDFYRNNSAQYLKNMISLLGYTGIIIPNLNSLFADDPIIHAIAFGPQFIQILDIKQ
jgi:hypothetical protein